MGVVLIDDGDRKTVVRKEDAVFVGWGRQRAYGPASAAAVDEYLADLQRGANVARALFVKLRGEARDRFHGKYPEGLLPDEGGPGEEVAAPRAAPVEFERPDKPAKGDRQFASASVDDPR